MNEDLNNTNGLEEVFSNNHSQSNTYSFNKFNQAKNNYHQTYNDEKINMFNTNEKSHLNECYSSDSDLDESPQSFFTNTTKHNI